MRHPLKKKTTATRQTPIKQSTGVPIHTQTASNPIPSAHLASPPTAPAKPVSPPTFSQVLPSPGILCSQITPQPIQWLWKDHIPLGKLTLLEGQPGIGTSLFTLLLAPDPDDEKQTLLITTKHSYSAKPKPIIFSISASDQGQPVIDWRGERQQPLISLQQAQSLHRQRILKQLQHSNIPLDAQSLTSYNNQDYEATRKMLQRMLKSGQLVSPARGFYTISGHPFLSDTPSQHDVSHPVPSVPNVPMAGSSSSLVLLRENREQKGQEQ